MDAVPNNAVSSGFDNPNANSVQTTIAPQAALNRALGQSQPQPATSAPQQSIPQATQQPQQVAPTPQPVQAQEQNNNSQDNVWNRFEPLNDNKASKNPWDAFEPLKDAKDEPNLGEKLIPPLPIEHPDLNATIGDKALDTAKGFGVGLGKAGIGMLTGPVDLGGKAMAAGLNAAFGDGTAEEPHLTESAINASGLGNYRPTTKYGQTAGIVGEAIPAALASMSSREAALAKQTKDLFPQSKVIPLTGGERSQIPELIRNEQQAAAGVAGQGAEKEALDFQTNRAGILGSKINDLGKVAEGATPSDHMGQVINIVRDEASKAKLDTDDAYNLARSLNKTNPVSVPVLDMEKNLGPKLGEIEDRFMLNRGVGKTSKAADVLNALKEKFVEPNEDEEVLKPSTLEDLEAWRRNATGVASDSTDPATRKSIGEMIKSYDDYTADLTKRLPNNSESIVAYKNAVGARAEQGARFGNSDMLDNIIHIGEKGYPKGIDDITRDFFGSGAIKGKQGMADNYSALMKAAGARAPEVQQHLQNGFAQKVFDGATAGEMRVPGSSNVNISPAKLATQLQNMFVNQRELATQVWDKSTVDHVNDLISDLKLVPKPTNPSGTAYASANLAKANTALTALSYVPGFSKIASVLKFGANTLKGVSKGQAEAKAAEQAATTFSGKIPDKFLPKTDPGLLRRTPTNAVSTVPSQITGILGNNNGPNK